MKATKLCDPLRLCVLCVFITAAPALNAAKQTNFLFFLVDDMGWADIGANGSTFHETPHIDRLAKGGMRFTHGYAAGSVCSPTRASIMTGRHPVRVDITDWIPGQSNRPANPLLHPDDRGHLPLKEVTIAEALKEHGYQTFFAGKWHLGEKGHWPTDQGFDINIGGHHRGSPPGGYYSPWTNPALKAKRKGEYLTERLTEESVKFLEERDPAKPFLLYLSYYNIHTPIQPYKKRIDHYQAKAAKAFDGNTPTEPEHEGTNRLRQDNPALASMVAAVDDSVGTLLGKLAELQLDKNTVVIFFSDNGGLSTLQRGRFGPGCNLPLRAGKGWLYEGGVREPTIIRAPGVTQPGSVSHKPMVSMDFFPTMLELAGLPAQPKLHIDGQSLLPQLNGDDSGTRTFYWHYPHYHGSAWKPGASIRDGDWKLIEFYHYKNFELYNLANDPGERNDLAKANPAKAKRLRTKLAAWQKHMKAKMPVPNPDYAHNAQPAKRNTKKN
ncbi:MAG: sulfatase [Verrucomicrobiota bacterium]|jgi:arylsulfatase A-like enzyme|nr:sulfatase [Verrucomicrobiota bacterium]MDP6752065.1 sulfatase [Verrucomicrobiota bacterium]